MKKRIFHGICGVALLSALVACVCVTAVLYQFSFDTMREILRDESVYVAASLGDGDMSELEAVKSAFARITLIDPDGTVVFDSLENPAAMENHADRPEVEAAFRTGAAEAQRYSETLATKTYYRAVRLQNGQVARVSFDMDSVWGTVLKYLPYFLLVFLAAVLISAISADYLARRIAAPLNGVNLDDPMSNDLYEELSPLLRRMEKQRTQINKQLQRLEEQRREFSAITGNMREGMVLLGKDAGILSINQSALAALALVREECIGRHILHMRRDEAFQNAVERGLDGKAGEAVLSIGGREYQLLVNPVTGGGEAAGTVLLLLDITERFEAEQMRREFTANVSHELKTPLTSISGFAEIIKDGMAKSADIPEFAQRIHSEAQRLITLVDDVIRLSRLDEKSGAELTEPVDLLALSREVAGRLLPLAQDRTVSIDVSGDAAAIAGVPHILEEMIGNLCDNAVKYNKDGGSVAITVEKQRDAVVLTVSDTGIGIPQEYHARVFERFYRVDKSHSKKTGGTGLGLSIVKHGAIFHSARLELESAEGVGTTVRLWFPVVP